ncbi:glycosyltransferase family 39 protein [Acetobacteraceae bacterium KSS8]|uniref:Glycosyltransferase family 39 protein n=1 Tax=Endosaccharibacter trunci TaxID=2812733 RepID=A0ABT1W7D3_9PROT|nr:glycosyltransferase family 39 protein [Acetobacteraceae bacterium KSS8]
MRHAVPRTVSVHRDHVGWLAAAAVFLLALALRLHGLGDKPYWLDEVTTLRRSALALVPLVRDSLAFHHLPLFFLVESPIERFGLGPFAMRLPAALFGALACALLVPIGRDASGRAPGLSAGLSVGLAAGLLAALSPFQVQYAQEARSYTLVLCFILIGIWGVVRLVRAPSGERSGWLLYAIGTALALDTLSVALFWFAAAQLCAALIAATRVGPGGRRWFVRRWLPVQALVLLVYLPFVFTMIVLTRGRMGSGLDWVRPASVHSVSTILQSVYLLRRSSLIAFRVFPGPLDIGGLPWPGLCVLALVVLGVLLRRRETAVQVLLITALALPVGIALCSLHSSLWMPRYLMWSGPILFLLAGLGVSSLSARARPPALALIAVLGLVNLWPYYATETKPLWNEAAAFLRDNRLPGDLLLVDDPASVEMMNIQLDPRAVLAGRIPAGGFAPGDWTGDVDTALAAQRAGRRVWAVHGKVGQNDSTTLGALLREAAPLGETAERRRIGLDITLLRFAPAAPRGSLGKAAP